MIKTTLEWHKPEDKLPKHRDVIHYWGGDDSETLITALFLKQSKDYAWVGVYGYTRLIEPLYWAYPSFPDVKGLKERSSFTSIEDPRLRPMTRKDAVVGQWVCYDPGEAFSWVQIEGIYEKNTSYFSSGDYCYDIFSFSVIRKGE